MAAEAAPLTGRQRIALLSLSAAGAFTTRLAVFGFARDFPVELIVALALWWSSRRFTLPAWQRAAWCVAATSFGRLGEPSWLPNLARVMSLTDLATGAPLSALASDPGARATVLGLLVGTLLAVLRVLHSAASWLGLALSLVGVLAVSRLKHPPGLRPLARAAAALGALGMGLSAWNSASQPELEAYVRASTTPIASLRPVELGTAPLTPELQLDRTYPAGVALRRGAQVSCSSAGGQDAVVSLRSWGARSWWLLEQDGTRLVIETESLRCVWPSQAVLGLRTKLPPGYLLGGILAVLLALASLVGRTEWAWLWLGGSLTALLPLAFSLASLV